GSGTSTTRTSCLPYQQFAFITFLLHSTSHSPVVSPRGAASPPGRLPFGRDDLTGLHHLLEAAQLILDLPFGGFAEELGHGRPSRPDTPARLIVPHVHTNAGAAPAGHALESVRAHIPHVRALKRAPCDQFVRPVRSNLGGPFDRPPCRRFRPPVRTSIACHLD